MSTFIRMSQPWIKSMHLAQRVATLMTMRPYSERGRSYAMVLPKISAAEQLARAIKCETRLESPEPIQRLVLLENVRSKINELDQRKMRHQEYDQMLKRLIVKPSIRSDQPKLPFKKTVPNINMRQELRNCSCIEEVLKLTSDSTELANELVHLCWELATEKRKNDVLQ